LNPTFKWIVQAEQFARCLVATNPYCMDEMYSQMAAIFIDGKPPQLNESKPEGTWVSFNPGYAFIGPPGGAHFFTVVRPEGVPDAAMMENQLEPPGRLFVAVQEALRTTERLASGQEVEVILSGQRIAFKSPAEHLEDVKQVGIQLASALSAAQLNYNHDVLREQAGLPIEGLSSGKSPLEIARWLGAAAMEARARMTLDARVFTLMFVRARLAECLPVDAPRAFQLILKSFEGAGVEYNPEWMLTEIVLAYVEAGFLTLVIQVLDQALELARTNRQQALAGADLRWYFTYLAQAAVFGFSAWALSDIVRLHVPKERWPAKLTEQKLAGYNSTAEETMVRGSIALVIGCINTFNRGALDRHIAAIQERGPAWAHELIEDYWYYPRFMRPVLLGEAGAAS
jgi:hypothetical protein